jgi:hypothetical protein
MISIHNNTPFYHELKDLFIKNILNIEKSQLEEYYQYWRLNFDSLSSDKIKILDNLIHSNQKVPKESILKGIDLPTWFGDFNNKRIVVLGIDPLRNSKVFNEIGADIHRNVLLGTPYAFHEKNSREKDCKSYWTLIDGLKKAGNFVYCTDIFKTYYYKDNEKIRSYNDPSYISNQYHKIILEEELNLINPDIIIIFGKLAHSFLLDKKCPKIGQSIIKTKENYILKNKLAEVYTVLHLSKTPRGHHFKSFFENNEINTQSLNVEDRVKCAEKYLEIFKKNKII